MDHPTRAHPSRPVPIRVRLRTILARGTENQERRAENHGPSHPRPSVTTRADPCALAHHTRAQNREPRTENEL
jgi:hypothetical protein